MLRRSGLARAVRDLGVRQRIQETSKRWPPGAWLWSFLYGRVYQGGGFRSFVMDGQSVKFDEAQTWAQQGTDVSNWRVTPEGGPFLEVNGVDEYMRVADNPRNRVGVNNLLIALVVRPATLPATAFITGKWDEASDDRAWALRTSGTSVTLSTSATGASGDVVTVTSSLVLTTGSWYFVAGFYEVNVQLKLWVGKTTDETVTADVETSVSTSIYAATGAYVTVGARSDELVEYLGGQLGILRCLIGTPSDDIDEYVYSLFDLVREAYWRYTEPPTPAELGALLLESGGYLLLESGGYLLLDTG